METIVLYETPVYDALCWYYRWNAVGIAISGLVLYKQLRHKKRAITLKILYTLIPLAIFYSLARTQDNFYKAELTGREIKLTYSFKEVLLEVEDIDKVLYGMTTKHGKTTPQKCYLSIFTYNDMYIGGRKKRGCKKIARSITKTLRDIK